MQYFFFGKVRSLQQGYAETGCFFRVEAPPVGLTTETVDGVIAVAFEGGMGAQPVVYKHLCGNNGSGGKGFGIGIVPGFGIVADITAAADILTGTVGREPRRLFVAGSHRSKGGGMVFAVGIDHDKHFQSLPAGADEKGQRKSQSPEKGGQGSRVGHMVEIEAYDTAVGFQLVGTVTAVERSRRGEAG